MGKEQTKTFYKMTRIGAKSDVNEKSLSTMNLDYAPVRDKYDAIAWALVTAYRAKFGVLPRLNPPISFNEHILHRIIFDRDPRLPIVCDKLAVRGLIEERVGKEYVVPLLGVWEHPKELTWHILPEKFVLKPNHASGFFSIVDRSAGVANIAALTAAAEMWLSYDYFDISLEWGYRRLPRRILAEPFLYSRNGDAAQEAKVYTFSGKAALINVLVGKKDTPERRGCWFDVRGRRVAVKKHHHPYAELQLSDSDRQEMVEIAERLSQGFSSLRVDFFMAINGLKIGELTPYTDLTRWDPPELDQKLGQLWNPNCDLSIIPDHKKQ